jgi:hypothetical protein
MVIAAGGPAKKLLRRSALLALIATLLAAQTPQPASPVSEPSVQIKAPRPNYPFPDGRSYVFSAEWHTLTAGTGIIRMESSGNGRRVVATAESAGAVNVIFPVRDRFESHFDSQTFCSQSIVKHSEEGSHKRETKIQFDYPERKSKLEEKNLRTGEMKQVENDIPGCATDILTGFYYLQSLPLELGATYDFPVNDGKSAIVHASVDKREDLKVPAGNYSTVQVTAEAISGSLQSKGKVWLWYSDDPAHIPIQMRAKLGFGTLVFRLQRIEK